MESMIHHGRLNAIKRYRAFGYSVLSLAQQYNLSPREIRAIVGEANQPLPEITPWQKYCNKLRGNK
jgi:hypothetical protein